MRVLGIIFVAAAFLLIRNGKSYLLAFQLQKVFDAPAVQQIIHNQSGLAAFTGEDPRLKELNTTFDQLLQDTKNLHPSMQEAFDTALWIIQAANGDYEAAIKRLDGETLSSYFNRAGVRFLYATTLSSGEDLNNLQLAVILTKQAIKEFDIAGQLSQWTIQSASKNNQILSKKLNIVVVIKLCLVEGKQIVKNLVFLQNLSTSLTNLLTKESTAIEAALNNSLSNTSTHECLQTLQKNVNNSLSSTKKLSQIFQNFYQIYLTRSLRNFDSPNLCLQEPFTGNLLESLSGTKESMKAMYSGHLELMQLLSWTGEQIAALCNKQQATDSSNQELMNLNEQLDDTLQKLKDNSEPGSGQTEKPSLTGASSNSELYDNLPANQEQEAIQAIEKRSNERIQTMEELTNQPGYDPNTYIHELFQEFYWKLK